MSPRTPSFRNNATTQLLSITPGRFSSTKRRIEGAIDLRCLNSYKTLVSKVGPVVNSILRLGRREEFEAGLADEFRQSSVTSGLGLAW